MRNPGGYAVWSSPDGESEQDTFTCFHCQKVVFVSPLQDPASIQFGGYCKSCMKLICRKCYEGFINGDGCKPWEKKIEAMEARGRFLRSAGLGD